MRVNVRGVIYESVRECAAALGVKPAAVYKAMQRGTLDNLGQPPNAPKPITIGGVSFPSIAALARYIGKDTSHTRRALQAGGPRALRNIAERVRNARKDRNAE